MSNDAEPINMTAPIVRVTNDSEQPFGPSEPGARTVEQLPPKVASSPNMLRVVHDALRGRYLGVVSAGLLIGALCAAAGWKLTRPKYSSEGLVRIAYALPIVRQETDQNAPVPMFDTFMQSQKTLIDSRRVIDQAIMDPVWKAYNRPVPATPDRYFASHLTVDVKHLSELIRLSVEDEDPATAAAAVTAIINAFQDLYNDQEKRIEGQRMGLLDDEKRALQDRMDHLSKDIRDKAQEYGTTNLSEFFSEAVVRVIKLEMALDDMKMAINNAQTATATPAGSEIRASGSSAGAASGGSDFMMSDPEMIAMTDPLMRNYIDQQDQRTQELNRLKVIYPDRNDKVIAAMENVERAKLKVADYAERYRTFHQATAQNPGGPGTGRVATAGMPVEALKDSEANLEKLLAQSREKMVALGNKELDFEQMNTDLIALKAESDPLIKRMEVLRSESQLGGRLTIISTGEVPLSPSTESTNKRLKLATLAGGAGFVLPAALVFMLSFVRRRYRFVDDTAKDTSLLNVPMLGMLPEVGRKLDPEILHATAHGIHQMRVLLCAKAPRNAKRSYLITSATEGEGKTNLTVALGMSFAAARHRTLVIDCDFVGRRLTRGFKADAAEGLLEAMRDGALGERVRQEGTRFFVLPTGRVESSDACGITTDNIREVLDQARMLYDTVIIDTGPILGSLEAAVVAQEVDGVILAISRGQHPTLVQHALQRLDSVRAVLAGAIFNRAKLQDFHTSAYTSSQTSAPYAEAAVERNVNIGVFADFGPLVRAVSLGIPAAA